MRIFNIFLVLNIVICYGGLCGDTVYSLTLSDNTAQSCHKMDHDNTRKDNENNLLNNRDKQDTYDSQCCPNSLLNSPTDEYSKVNLSLTLVLPSTCTYLEKYESLKSPKDRMLRGHDPPDLQISNSTFLL